MEYVEYEWNTCVIQAAGSRVAGHVPGIYNHAAAFSYMCRALPDIFQLKSDSRLIDMLMFPAGCALRLDAQVSLNELRHHVAAASRPLLVTGLTSEHHEGEGSAAAFVADAQQLARSTVGGASVAACDSPIFAQVGDDGDGPRRSLRDYLESIILDENTQFDDSPFAFDQGAFLSSEGGRALAERLHTERADAALGSGDGRLVFSLGPKAGGLTWHFHPYSWLELLVGEKRWWTAAHGNASLHFDATLPTAAWIDSALGGDPLATPPEGVCAFTQLPGEIVVVPGLQHATYNMAAYTVGYGRQDRWPRPSSYQALHDAALDGWNAAVQAGAWPDSGLAALRDGLARYPADAKLLFLESNRLAAMGSQQDAEDALLYAERSLGANPQCVETQFTVCGLLWRLGEHQRALCSARAMLGALEPTTQTHGHGRVWSQPHPSRSRSAALREAHVMVDDFERMGAAAEPDECARLLEAPRHVVHAAV